MDLMEKYPLLNALVAAFPDAIGLRSGFIYMKDNMEDHLRNNLRVKSEVK